MPTHYCNCLVIVIVVFIFLCDSAKINENIKKKKVDANGRPFRNSKFAGMSFENATSDDQGRGFASSILSLGRVFNFFPVGGERECRPSIDTVALAGICLNPYDCRQRDGKASGDCAHGLGVCCVFEVTCGATIENNLTYFKSPGFPEPWNGEQDCNVTIHKSYAGIMQLRIDFVQFTIGQPNRTTGECDEDAMILGEGVNNFTLCGQNYGQHLYYNLPSGSEKRDAGELAGTKSTLLSIRMRGSEMPRLWLMRLAQLPIANSAPHNCLQYFTDNNGTIKTFNYAYNGRHLSGHDYRACVRKNTGFCAIRYSPCDSRSFRIAPGENVPQGSDPSELMFGPGESGGAGTGFNGTDGAFSGVVTTTPLPATTTSATLNDTLDEQASETQSQNVTQIMEDGMMPADEVGIQEDEMEGSGEDPNRAPPIESAPAQASPGLLARIWSFIWPSWMWGQRGRADSSTRRLDGGRIGWDTSSDKSIGEDSRGGYIKREDRRKKSIHNSGWEIKQDWSIDDKSWNSKEKHKKSGRRWDSESTDSKTWKWTRWSPYAQHYTQEDDKLRYYGYGKYGAGLRGYGRQRCRDRITIPCENEYFVSSSSYVPGVCDPHHCGASFCPGLSFDKCRVETSIAPFAVSVHFGPPTVKRSPEENIGACLKYSQLPCDS